MVLWGAPRPQTPGVTFFWKPQKKVTKENGSRLADCCETGGRRKHEILIAPGLLANGEIGGPPAADFLF